MYWNGEALAARAHILETALHHALRGAGIGGAVLLTTIFGAAGRLLRSRRDGTANPETAAHPYRPRTAPAWHPAGRLANRLEVGRGRVPQLVVPEADLAEIAGPDGVVDLVQTAHQAGAAQDGGEGRRALPAAPFKGVTFRENSGPSPVPRGRRCRGRHLAAKPPAGAAMRKV